MKAVVLCCVLGLAAAVDRGNFKTCDQSSFCKRNRALQVCRAADRVVRAHDCVLVCLCALVCRRCRQMPRTLFCHIFCSLLNAASLSTPSTKTSPLSSSQPRRNNRDPACTRPERLGTCFPKSYHLQVACVCCTCVCGPVVTSQMSTPMLRVFGLLPQPGESKYRVEPGSINLQNAAVTMDLVNKENNVYFTLTITALEDSTARSVANVLASVRTGPSSPEVPRCAVPTWQQRPCPMRTVGV